MHCFSIGQMPLTPQPHNVGRPEASLPEVPVPVQQYREQEKGSGLDVQVGHTLEFTPTNCSLHLNNQE